MPTVQPNVKYCGIRIMTEYGIWDLLKHLLDRADEIFVDAYQTAVGRQLELLALFGPHHASLKNHRAVGSQVDGRRARCFAVFPYELNSKFHLNLHEEQALAIFKATASGAISNLSHRRVSSDDARDLRPSRFICRSATTVMLSGMVMLSPSASR